MDGSVVTISIVVLEFPVDLVSGLAAWRFGNEDV